MRALLFVALLFVVGCAASAPEADPYEQDVVSISDIETVVPADTGRFVREDRNRQGQLLLGRTGLILTSVVAQAANDVNERVAMPVNVPVFSEPCGEENAYYSPNDHFIVICDDLLAAFDRWFETIEDSQERHDLTFGALEFITLHEMGHALVDQLDLPVLGRNEDAADLLAAYISVKTSDADRMLGGINYFLNTAKERIQRNGSNFAYWDEHGLGEQRMSTVACYLFGSDPDQYSYLVGGVALPVDPSTDDGLNRLRRCRADFLTAERDIEALLAPHRRAD